MNGEPTVTACHMLNEYESPTTHSRDRKRIFVFKEFKAVLGVITPAYPQMSIKNGNMSSLLKADSKLNSAKPTNPLQYLHPVSMRDRPRHT